MQKRFQGLKTADSDAANPRIPMHALLQLYPELQIVPFLPRLARVISSADEAQEDISFETFLHILTILSKCNIRNKCLKES